MKTIADHIIDLVQNSVRADSKNIEIYLSESIDNDELKLKISDNGCGMTETQLQYCTDSFFSTKKGKTTGLGLPLIKQAAELTEGKLKIKSKEGKGTTLEALFGLSHYDRQPLGSLAESISFSICNNPEIEYTFIYMAGKEEFSITTSEIKEAIGEELFRRSETREMISEIIRTNLSAMGLYDFGQKRELSLT